MDNEDTMQKLQIHIANLTQEARTLSSEASALTSITNMLPELSVGSLYILKDLVEETILNIVNKGS